MSKCIFLVRGVTDAPCNKVSMEGICEQHLEHAKYIVETTDYDGYNQADVCAGIIKPHDHYPACDNKPVYGGRFCRTHLKQIMSCNLEFINFIREKQGLPTFMDWEPTIPVTPTVQHISSLSRKPISMTPRNTRTDFPTGDYTDYMNGITNSFSHNANPALSIPSLSTPVFSIPSFSYPRGENFKHLF